MEERRVSSGERNRNSGLKGVATNLEEELVVSESGRVVEGSVGTVAGRSPAGRDETHTNERESQLFASHFYPTKASL